MTSKEEYRSFCQQKKHKLPIFMQDWWLDAVCAGKTWDVLLVKNAQGDILAALPYLLRKRMGIKYILMPQMTQVAGPWVSDEVKKSPHLLHEVVQDLVRQLDGLKLAYYYQHFALNSAVPSLMSGFGFKVNERVTYRIEDLSNLDALISSFSKNKKRQLQKALSLNADRTLDVEDFYRFHMDCLKGRGKQISYVREFLLVLDRKVKRNNCGQIMAIRNMDGQLLAAAYVVWDDKSMYYLIPCYDERYKDSGASALLVLECVKLAREKGVAFDFEGSMIRGVANHYKQFGSLPTKYNSVERYYRWWFRLATLYNWFKERKIR